jgi:ABC-type multidrug transport system ATPase subunit
MKNRDLKRRFKTAILEPKRRIKFARRTLIRLAKAMATLRWTDVKVSTEMSNGACKGKYTKTIIHGSSGVIRPGEILAVIGPSGAGKTTLFNVLARRAATTIEYTGELLLNNRHYQSTTLRSCSGFVWQVSLRPMAYCINDDPFFQKDALYQTHLTPREVLNFSARLKLPSPPFGGRANSQSGLIASCF